MPEAMETFVRGLSQSCDVSVSRVVQDCIEAAFPAFVREGEVD